MPLFVIIGSSGSGKTTFLEDVFKLNKCCYLRQYHKLRPYIMVSQLPNFDPSQLPYWSLYNQKSLASGESNKSYKPNIQVGGTIGADVVPGLSGGQRKMMFFELVKQRTENLSGLLIAMDEPFTGVTDDFLPFIVSGLTKLRAKHNVVTVTNDHVKSLTQMADHIFTVSATNRTQVAVNGNQFDREVVVHALALGAKYPAASLDKQAAVFFFRTEVLNNPQILGTLGFSAVMLGLLTLAFQGSKAGSEALILVASNNIGYFAVNPYFLSLPDWRASMAQEAEALLHTSQQMSFILKTLIALTLLTIVSVSSFGLLQTCIDTLRSSTIFGFMFFDSLSLTLPFILFGLYTQLPMQAVQMLASIPFLTMLFFSTTFSPGSGLPGLNDLRFVYVRFYFWCALPIGNTMESCPPNSDLMGFAVLNAISGLLLFIFFQGMKVCAGKLSMNKALQKQDQLTIQADFQQLKAQLYRQ